MQAIRCIRKHGVTFDILKCKCVGFCCLISVKNLNWTTIIMIAFKMIDYQLIVH